MNEKKGLNKKLIALVIIITVIAALVLFVYIPAPSELELNEQNSDIYSLLVAAGIKDALVDVTQKQVIVSYDMPENLGKEASWYYVMGAVAGVAPQSEKLKIQSFVNDKPTEEVTVRIKDIQDYLEGKITDSDFKSKLVISQPTYIPTPIPTSTQVITQTVSTTSV